MSSCDLHIAARNMAIDDARRLIANGADINAVDGMSRTALHLACWKGDSDMVQLLLRSKASTSMKAKDHFTALHFAVQAGSLECCKLLLDQNKLLANMRVSKGNKTPLHMAAAKGNIDIVKLLLVAGCDPAALTNKKQTALDFADENSIFELIKSSIEEKIDSGARKDPTRKLDIDISTSTPQCVDSQPTYTSEGVSRKRAAGSARDELDNQDHTFTSRSSGHMESNNGQIRTVFPPDTMVDGMQASVDGGCAASSANQSEQQAVKSADSGNTSIVKIDISKRKKKRAKIGVHMSHLYADEDVADESDI